MDNSQCPVARKSGLVVQEMPDEVLVYDLNSNKAHCLNQTAAKVWQACDGSQSISDIAAELGKGNNEDLVWLAIDQLSENDLLEAKVASKFKGQSRRDVIKKIGLASIIAVPVIASLVAPQNALAAQSCNCINNGQCITGPNGNGSGGTRCPSATCNGSGHCAP
jgi:Coenzyme PQQ synthesis protein D (PqqD)